MCSEPSDADRELVNSAGVIFVRGAYHFDEYRHDQFADVFAHACLVEVRDTASTIR